MKLSPAETWLVIESIAFAIYFVFSKLYINSLEMQLKGEDYE